MDKSSDFRDADVLATQMEAEICALSEINAPKMREIRRKFSRLTRQAGSEFILDVARALSRNDQYRWFAYELITHHPLAFRSISEKELEEFGQGINSWWSVDSFARILAGPAWLRGQVPDAWIMRWAGSDDFWWRRAALVSTVALNVRSQGGKGDVPRTLAVCRLLVKDRQVMVVKALSWALRALVVHDPKAVESFLDDYDDDLAALVKREVRHKLATGLKYPKRIR